ncbi:hypothetical protein [Salegentibacter chungangensis]|uniref:Uncharacterized protein n=1 Tax=Salegentibacter chungangensis TaxID=1335724 RepID=A0ABW3NVB3_9FLAO
MWEIFISNQLYISYIFEILAALAGLFYLFKSRSPGRDVKLLVYLLVFIFVYDITALSWGLYGHVYDFKYLEFVNDSPFASHFWIANAGNIISVALFSNYFALQLASLRRRKFIYILIGLYMLSSVVSFGIGDAFFKTTSPFGYIFGTFIISLSIGLYYLELVGTERILRFKTELALYISIGLLVRQLCATPIFLFQKFIAENPEFREVYNYVLDGSNFFMYTMFAAGFIIKYLELRKKNNKGGKMQKPVLDNAKNTL